MRSDYDDQTAVEKSRHLTVPIQFGQNAETMNAKQIAEILAPTGDQYICSPPPEVTEKILANLVMKERSGVWGRKASPSVILNDTYRVWISAQKTPDLIRELEDEIRRALMHIPTGSVFRMGISNLECPENLFRDKLMLAVNYEISCRGTIKT